MTDTQEAYYGAGRRSLGIVYETEKDFIASVHEQKRIMREIKEVLLKNGVKRYVIAGDEQLNEGFIDKLNEKMQEVQG